DDLRRVNGAGRRELARIQAKRFDMNDSRFKVRVGFQERANGVRGNVPTTRKRHVGMEGAQVRLEASGEDSFLDAFVELKQMRVPSADADPENCGPTLRWKS